MFQALAAWLRVPRSSSELSGTATVFCCLLSVGQLESTTFVSDSNLRLLDCFVSSPLKLWDLSLHRHAIVHNLGDELRLGKLDYLCVFMWSQLHLCDGLFQNRQWYLHLDDLFDDSLWVMLLAHELRLRTTVFAGALNVTQRTTRLSSWCQVLSVYSPNPSVDVFPRILTGSPTSGLRSSFDFFVNHLGVILLLVHLDFVVLRHAVFVLFLWCLLCFLRNLDIDGRVTVLTQWDIRRSPCLLNHRHLSLYHHKNVSSLLFEILLDCGGDLLLIAAVFAC